MPTPMPTPEAAFEMYRRLVEENDQAIPILLYASGEQAFPVGMTGEIDNMQKAIARLLNGLLTSVGQADWIVFSCEAYAKVASQEELDNYQPGSYAAAAAAGDTSVVECAMITGVSSDGTAWASQTPFVRSGGTVTWRETSVVENIDGGISDLLCQAVR